ncbi:MAG: Asp-tRNA(Asn)/Glu-tRNA(Gln) amidotransferase subunit GatC [Methylococcales bacterium]|jgi:aspartyl-tRNA(Asn)/glutamyl-tRNA(Gln) amidotransferase subunit C|nr:Asp-tRNA(Asn)/Glu-tRNA(Gln) amidotransferase subunit GatC [Methylococcales bacterium]MBT7442641.1 Asp-tRNA(Asn)/Glu-tRNA(Gln) amidotransferase subunit GatC [Methylococcales bacterium]
MSLERSDVEKIANLARLALNEDDIPAYTRDLSSILTLVEQLNQADTDNIEPMAHPVDATQRLRDDVVKEQNQRDKFQSIAPEVDNGLYLVPQVIE